MSTNFFITAENPPEDENGDLRWVRDTLLPGFELPRFKSCAVEANHGRQFVRLWASENPRLQDEVVFAAVQNHEMEFVEIKNASEMWAQDLVSVAYVLLSLYAEAARVLSLAERERGYSPMFAAKMHSEAEGMVAAANHILNSEGGRR